MRFLLVASLLFAASTARADAPAKTTGTPDAKQMHTDDCAKARSQNKTCIIDMGKGDDVTGNSPTGDGIGVAIVNWGKATSLIHIRRDFIVEILKSAEDL